MEGNYVYKYPHPAVTTDCVIFGYDPKEGLSVLLVKRGIEPSIELCLKYCKENDVLVISSVVCCVIACSFVAFLIMRGVEALVVRFMMRHANTGGR